MQGLLRQVQGLHVDAPHKLLPRYCHVCENVPPSSERLFPRAAAGQRRAAEKRQAGEARAKHSYLFLGPHAGQQSTGVPAVPISRRETASIEHFA